MQHPSLWPRHHRVCVFVGWIPLQIQLRGYLIFSYLNIDMPQIELLIFLLKSVLSSSFFGSVDSISIYPVAHPESQKSTSSF